MNEHLLSISTKNSRFDTYTNIYKFSTKYFVENIFCIKKGNFSKKTVLNCDFITVFLVQYSFEKQNKNIFNVKFPFFGTRIYFVP